MPREVELKFDVDPGDVERVRDSGPLRAAAADTKAYDSVYFDTADRALRRAGFSLRVRRADGRFVQTIKHKKAGAVGLFVRREWETDVPAFALDVDALRSSPVRRILERKGVAALQPLIRTGIRRTKWLVAHRSSRIEVVLDEGRVVSGEVEAPICELELELLEGKPNALFRVAQEIAATAPLRLGVLSKGERGYAMADGRLGQAAKAEPIRLTARLTEGDAFQAVANGCLRHFRINEIALLSGRRDPEALHQARVALRRLRSAMTLFAPTLAGDEHDFLRSELRWFARQLGHARNLDVLIARSGPNAAPAGELVRRREQAYDKVAELLRARRIQALFLRLAMWIEGGAWRSGPRASQPVVALAERQLARQWKKVARDGPSLAELGPKAMHKLRVDVKKLRYSVEFLAGLYARTSARADRNRLVAALKTLQERLGDLTDAQMASELASRHGQAVGPAKRSRSRPALGQAQRAFDRAAAAAGFWRSG